MKQVLLVGLGGFIGSIGRYKLGGWVLHHTTDWRFPLSTFLVNVVGCLVIGVLAGVATRQHVLSLDVRLFLFPGILGGFTTFSAFGYETFFLMRRGESHVALLYVLLSVVCGLVTVWLGYKLTAGSGG
jgi:fluoride exporter